MGTGLEHRWQTCCGSNGRMPRQRRMAPGGFVYHVCNRGSRKGVLFADSRDFDGFVRLLHRAREERPIKIIAYCLLRTHIHLLLWPAGDGDLSRFMHWLESVHASAWHRQRRSRGTGAVYQSRFVSVGISEDRHYYTALRYVERNALAAKLVKRAQDWRWCSASPRSRLTLDSGPYPRPANWFAILNGE